jgi:hypothetical protein
MAQNIVDVSWDLAKFDEQTQAVLANMTKVYELANQAKATGIKLGSDGGFTELKKQAADFNKVQEQTLKLTKLQELAEQARIKTQKEAALAAKAQDAAEQQRLKTQAAQLDLTKKQASANEKAAKNAYNPANVPFVITPINTDELKNTSVLVNDIDKAEASAAISATEFGNSVNKSTGALNDQGAVAQKTSADIIREKEIQKQLERQIAQELKNNVREQLAAKGSLEQRRAALIRLNASYDQLNASERNSPYGVRLKSTIAGVTTQVKELEAATGRAQRNVGNYPGAFKKLNEEMEETPKKGKRALGFLNKAYGSLRKLAYAIPGIGMSGIILLLLAPLESVGAALVKWSNQATKSGRDFQALQDHIKNLDAVVDKAADSFSNATSQVNKLTEDVKLAKDGFLDKDKVLKEYNDTMGKTTGQLKSFDQLEAKIVADGPDYIQLLFLKAKATAAYALAGEAARKALTAQQDAEKNFGTTDFLATNKLNILKQAFGFGNVADAGQNAAVQVNKNAAEIKKQQEKAFADLNKQGDDFEKQAAELAKKHKWNFFDNDGKGGGKKGSVTMDSVKEQLDAEFELYKIAQQRKIKLLDEEQNDTTKSFQERIVAAEDFTNASIELSDRTYQHEIDNDKKKLEILKENYKKSKGTERNNLKVDIDNAAKEITITQAKQNDARLALQQEFGKKFVQITKDTEAERLRIIQEAEKSIQNVYTEQKNAIEANRATEKAAHDKLLHDKVIGQEKYDKLEKKSIKENAILAAQSDLQKAQRMKDLVFTNSLSTTEDKNNAVNNVATANANLISAQNPDDKTDKGLEKRQEIVKDAELITQTINSLVDIGYQKEIDAIQKIIDLNEERKNREIANINASTLSNQEKAAQMLLLDNTVAANNKKLKREQVAVQIKQAKFDRDMAVLGILENVAAANFKLIAQGGFAGIAAGVAVGLQAVSATAMLMAKPLPQMPAYAKGTDNHPGGPAIVGEGQYKELVTEPGGKSFIAGRPMLLNNLPKGSKVTPLTSDMINQSMYNSMVIGTAQRIQAGEIAIQKNSNRDIIEAIELGSIRTVQAMKKQKGSHVTVNINGNWNAYINKVVKE